MRKIFTMEHMTYTHHQNQGLIWGLVLTELHGNDGRFLRLGCVLLDYTSLDAPHPCREERKALGLLWCTLHFLLLFYLSVSKKIRKKEQMEGEPSNYIETFKKKTVCIQTKKWWPICRYVSVRDLKISPCTMVVYVPCIQILIKS